jgi:internalin A
MEYSVIRAAVVGFVSFAVLIVGGVATAEECTDPVWVPDPGLRDAIMEALNSFDEITCDEMESLGELDASQRDIVDVEGLQFAVNLEGLFLQHNRIGDLSPLDGAVFPSLEVLRLTANEIHDIDPLAGMPAMWRLYIGRNPVDDLEVVANFHNLDALDVGATKIESSDLVWLRELPLVYFVAYQNEIDDISDLAAISTLGSVVVMYNQISDLSPLAQLPSLEIVGADSNPITELPDFSGTSLGVLTCRSCLLSHLDGLVGVTTLEQLYVEQNRINDIDGIANLPNLSLLNLSSNSLRNIDALDGHPGLVWPSVVDLRLNCLKLGIGGSWHSSAAAVIKRLREAGVTVYDLPQRICIGTG